MTILFPSQIYPVSPKLPGRSHVYIGFEGEALGYLTILISVISSFLIVLILEVSPMYSLALIYIDNSLNLERGIKLLTKVADSGNLDACYLLGLKYKYGNGVTKDKDKAKYYLKKAKGK